MSQQQTGLGVGIEAPGATEKQQNHHSQGKSSFLLPYRIRSESGISASSITFEPTIDLDKIGAIDSNFAID